ncbi:MAG TPA: hypothetical protein VM184_06730, partial [Gaiellaceae bacterium]|nr:hypothetical protein [Gaiellaceae bacterium]
MTLVTPRKNIFLIARKGHEADENQLTEMLAYLFQEEPELIPEWLSSLGIEEGAEGWEIETQRAIPGGFLDLVLFSPGKALVIMESKLGTTTSFEQIGKYIAYAKGYPVAGARALVFTTQSPEPWPNGVEMAAADDVRLVLRRWQALGDFLKATDNRLAHDFAEMLEKEGLVTPQALTAQDWAAWREGNRVARQLRTLLNEAGDDLKGVAPGFVKHWAVTFSNNGAVYRPFEFEGLSLYVGFWPSRKPEHPDDHALITVYALNTRLPPAERKAAGQAAVERAA